jgi:hypothetical protein
MRHRQRSRRVEDRLELQRAAGGDAGEQHCGGSLRCMRNIATKRARIAARGLLARPYLRIEKPRTGKCGRA